jgi:anaerobic ribonucleoside-triphosphate reductase
VIEARSPLTLDDKDVKSCMGCGGAKAAPIATIFSVSHAVGYQSVGFTFTLCEECGRDAANAIGFMCIKEGGWSRIEPRKRKAAR